jgi:hypothetical protein
MTLSASVETIGKAFSFADIMARRMSGASA